MSDSESTIGVLSVIAWVGLAGAIVAWRCRARIRAKIEQMNGGGASTTTYTSPAVYGSQVAPMAPKPVPVGTNPFVPNGTVVDAGERPAAVTVNVQCGQCRAAVVVQAESAGTMRYTCPTCGALNEFSINDKGHDKPPEATLPSYWASDRSQGGKGLVMASESTKRAMQVLLDNTWKSQITRDRPGHEKVPKFEVIMVHRNENLAIWDSYVRTRDKIAEECAGCETWQVKTATETTSSPDASELFIQADLNENVNEFYMFHGTKPSAARAICDSDFLLDMAGRNAGTLYGPGLYFAEASSKSDEYAQEDKEGIFAGLYAMLVCRVACGNINYTDEVKPHVQGLVDSILTKKTHHTILGDREKARGTYREFIVFDKDQVYPEFVIVYRRVPAEP